MTTPTDPYGTPEPSDAGTPQPSPEQGAQPSGTASGPPAAGAADPAAQPYAPVEPPAPAYPPGPPYPPGRPYPPAQPYPSAAAYGDYAQPAPPNYLVWAILATILCCLPLGIVSIVFSTQVNSRWLAGDLVGAQEASRRARLFAISSAAVGVAGAVIGLVLLATIGFSLSDGHTTY